MPFILYLSLLPAAYHLHSVPNLPRPLLPLCRLLPVRPNHAITIFSQSLLFYYSGGNKAHLRHSYAAAGRLGQLGEWQAGGNGDASCAAAGGKPAEGRSAFGAAEMEEDGRPWEAGKQGDVSLGRLGKAWAGRHGGGGKKVVQGHCGM